MRHAASPSCLHEARRTVPLPLRGTPHLPVASTRHMHLPVASTRYTASRSTIPPPHPHLVSHLLTYRAHFTSQPLPPPGSSLAGTWHTTTTIPTVAQGPGSVAELHLPPTLPTFNPEPGSSTGLHLLASVVSSAHAGSGPLPYSEPQSKAVPGPALASRGPYNPAAVLLTKVAKRILDLDFVEMSEIALDDPPVQVPGQPPLPARPPVQDISVWVEKYSVMAALLASRFPEKAPELFAYQASIVRAERNFVDRRWVAYDQCFRREALAQKNLDWSVPNARLYNEAFTGWAKALPRCSFCLQEDHVAQYCP